MRVAQVVVQFVLLDQHDAPIQSEQSVFVGTADGTALENAIAALEELPAKLADKPEG